MSKLLYPPTVNALQKQLNADYSASDAVITLTNTTGVQNKPGVILINRIDANNSVQAASGWTYIEYAGTSGATLTGCVAIAGDQDHGIGQVVEFVSDVTQQQRILDSLANLVDVDTLALDTTKVVDLTTSQTLTNKSLTSPIMTGTVSATADGVNVSSMSRQAIINSNFDIIQRVGPFTPLDANVTYTADHWLDYVNKDGGTLPTLSVSRIALTAGEIFNSFYAYRLTTNGAGTSLGTASSHLTGQRIEQGTRFLCGANKKVTVSFYARSSIANKKLAIALQQNYGTGGSPTAAESIAGTVFSLTSNFTKYTFTFTTNTLTGKTFGTDNNDILELDFLYVWGTAINTIYGGAFGGAETYVGSGTIDIAQVQLCSGPAALPYQPKNYAEELRSCQRYYFRINNPYASDSAMWGVGRNSTTTTADIFVTPPVPMRGALSAVEVSAAADIAVTQIVTGRIYASSLQIITASPTSIQVTVTVASGLTAGQGTFGLFANGTSKYIAFQAEM